MLFLPRMCFSASFTFLFTFPSQHQLWTEVKLRKSNCNIPRKKKNLLGPSWRQQWWDYRKAPKGVKQLAGPPLRRTRANECMFQYVYKEEWKGWDELVTGVEWWYFCGISCLSLNICDTRLALEGTFLSVWLMGRGPRRKKMSGKSQCLHFLLLYLHANPQGCGTCWGTQYQLTVTTNPVPVSHPAAVT